MEKSCQAHHGRVARGNTEKNYQAHGRVARENEERRFARFAELPPSATTLELSAARAVRLSSAGMRFDCRSLRTTSAHCCAIFLGHLGIDIQISISERSSGWAIN